MIPCTHSFNFFRSFFYFSFCLYLKRANIECERFFSTRLYRLLFSLFHFVFILIFLASSFRLKYLCRFSFFKKNIHTDIIYLHWMCVCALYVCFFSTCCCCLAMIWGKHLIVRIILARRMKKCVQIIVYKFLEVLAVVEMAAATAIATLTVAVPI